VAAVALAVAGCGSSSSGRSSSRGAVVQHTAGASAPARSLSSTGASPARRLERALLTNGGSPPPTSAACRSATTAERDAAPFGRTRRPVFSCLITVNGERARYAVQVLGNGCYVAERHRPGRAVYGCGAGQA
jgi:hypothetical protein